ncbi:uncharacterized protein LOC124694356 [Lolium rigidum]|uniref:uncharacterized protein LOC124694356 n=1 Tax=Lolium rigidum TaxID=89674 RepID=UPI001F5D7A16|nr:uncharacterized protein LOC124694356 [Lolium rigidum]
MIAQVGVLLASMQLMIFMWDDRSSWRPSEETLDAGESISKTIWVVPRGIGWQCCWSMVTEKMTPSSQCTRMPLASPMAQPSRPWTSGCTRHLDTKFMDNIFLIVEAKRVISYLRHAFTWLIL